MTLEELAAAIGPLADVSLDESNDQNVIKIGIVLAAAIMGAIAGGREPDEVVLDELADHAGLICQQRRRRRPGRPRVHRAGR